MEILYIPLKKVSSTQTYAHLHKKTFDPNDLTVVIAEEQTQARGTFQKNGTALLKKPFLQPSILR